MHALQALLTTLLVAAPAARPDAGAVAPPPQPYWVVEEPTSLTDAPIEGVLILHARLEDHYSGLPVDSVDELITIAVAPTAGAAPLPGTTTYDEPGGLVIWRADTPLTPLTTYHVRANFDAPEGDGYGYYPPTTSLSFAWTTRATPWPDVAAAPDATEERFVSACGSFCCRPQLSVSTAAPPIDQRYEARFVDRDGAELGVQSVAGRAYPAFGAQYPAFDDGPYCYELAAISLVNGSRATTERCANTPADLAQETPSALCRRDAASGEIVLQRWVVGPVATDPMDAAGVFVLPAAFIAYPEHDGPSTPDFDALTVDVADAASGEPIAGATTYDALLRLLIWRADQPLTTGDTVDVAVTLDDPNPANVQVQLDLRLDVAAGAAAITPPPAPDTIAIARQCDDACCRPVIHLVGRLALPPDHILTASTTAPSPPRAAFPPRSRALEGYEFRLEYDDFNATQACYELAVESLSTGERGVLRHCFPDPFSDQLADSFPRCRVDADGETLGSADSGCHGGRTPGSAAVLALTALLVWVSRRRLAV